jgi:hypothetical protein
MTTVFWTNLWWWWLLSIALSFCLLEGVSIWRAGGAPTWTLSDTIRRWATSLAAARGIGLRQLRLSAVPLVHDAEPVRGPKC